jgi:excisionase family DNA binding protein
MMNDIELQLWKISEVADVLSVSARTVYNLIEEGKLERVHPRPQAARITGSSLLKFVAGLKDGEKIPTQEPLPEKVKSKAQGIRDWLGL